MITKITECGYDFCRIAVKALKETRQYVTQANHTATARHDNYYGDYYMDGGQYEIMKETENLLSEINKIIAQFDRIDKISS